MKGLTTAALGLCFTLVPAIVPSLYPIAMKDSEGHQIQSPDRTSLLSNTAKAGA
jgi:hypothetical protein